MILYVIILLTISKGVVPRELHPEKEAANLFGVEEDILPEPDVSYFDQTNGSSVNDSWLNGYYEDTNSENANDIKWFKENIVDKYGFVKMARTDMWEKQGNFAPYLKDEAFIAAASRVKEFFKRNKEWQKTKSNPEFRKTGKCLELLYITAARYLFVTHVLMEVSGGSITSCGKDGVLNKIPPYVCYPEPYGTASCTSDYDVGLIGKDSGSITAKFNKYFQDPSNGFGNSSEFVFDTNVYAFTLEYAMPSIFSGLPSAFENKVQTAENSPDDPDCRMQELAGSYFKVFKYNKDFAKQLLTTALSHLEPKKNTSLQKWHSQIEALNALVPLANIPNLRATHNEKYQQLVEQISTLYNGYDSPKESLVTLAQALLYAAEAYHTRGAIRHVVGGTQMKLPQYQTEKLSLNDLWVSMIENWGETNKEYNHCRKEILEKCLLKMSKYMWRMFAAMKFLRQGISGRQRGGLVSFAGAKDPETMMSYWLDVYKRKGYNKVSSNEDFVEYFFRTLECPRERLGQPISYECMQSINNKVDVYNRKIADPKIIKSSPQFGKQNDQEDGHYYDEFIEEIMSN